MKQARGVVAVILAAGVAVAVIITALGAALHRGPIAEAESNLLSTVLGAGVGAVATFLGGAELRARSSSSRTAPERPPDADDPGSEDLEAP